jgi:cytochrome c2
MPDFRCSEQQITELINVLMAEERQNIYSSARTVMVVHFADRRGEPENVFEKQCGPCHKALSPHNGALGRGAAGPNLSGLFSPWYPQPPALNKRWTPALLQKRLQNPRTFCTTAAMQPVSLTPAEFRELLLILGGSSEAAQTPADR